MDETAETITCRRCGEERPALPKPPYRNELGERIAAEICRTCWQEWLQHQTLLINHYGLDPRTPDARKFLYEQTEKVLFEEGEPEEVDTSKEGEIDWT